MHPIYSPGLRQPTATFNRHPGKEAYMLGLTIDHPAAVFRTEVSEKEVVRYYLPFSNLGPFNRLSHQFFAMLGPVLYRRPINDWRRNVLGLPPAKRETHLNGRPVTTLYAYSPSVIPRPADWDDTVVVTGYWFLDAPVGWQPDPALVQFIQNGPPPVYVGFGSMFMGGGVHKTAMVTTALKLAGQRGVLATGWGGLTKGTNADDIFVVDSVPHDWLFPQMTAIVHHGGAGTTAAALRAGKPGVICPFVGDQFFWGRRVAALGAGPAPIPQRKLTAERLAEAIQKAVTDPLIQSRSAALGEKIRAEDGVGQAVRMFP
ncbi:MAG: glycosyltransferase [Chloroflexota bacterium]